MRIIKRSPVTGQFNARDIDVTVEQLVAWQSGVLIQDAMPHLSAEDREFILTGMTPEDWEAMFGEPEPDTCPVCEDVLVVVAGLPYCATCDCEVVPIEPAPAEPECEACGLPLDNEHDRFCDADCAEIAQEVRA